MVEALPPRLSSDAPDARTFRQVWAAAAIGGALVGLGQARWQVAVESGQVLAGLVRYPPDNPFYLYHLKLWTLANQIAALLLKAGLSEAAASMVMSALIGLVSFSALALIVLAFTRQRLVSILVPFFIHVTPLPQLGVTYGISIVGTPHTYGALGLSLDVLVLALLACGRFRPGLFLLGLAPAVHASLGAWLWILAGAAIATSAESRAAFRRELPFFLAGCGLTALSLLAQVPYMLAVPKPTEDVRPYFDAFMRAWDGHRMPIDLGGAGVRVALAAGAVALLWLRPFSDEVPVPARLFLRALVAASLLGLVIVPVSFVDPARLPRLLMTFMPNRMLNVSSLSATPVLIALLALRRSPWRGAGFLLLLAGLVVEPRSLYVHTVARAFGTSLGGLAPDRVRLMGLAVLVLVAAAFWERRPGIADRLGSRALRVAAMAILWTAPVLASWLVWSDPPNLHAGRRVFAELARGEGLIATAGDLQLVQVRTRRPVLLDGGGLDSLPYAPAAAPQMARILLKVYDVDLLYPPPLARRRASIPIEHTREVWERRTREEWKAIRREFGVRHVLALRDWDLDLPAGVGNVELLIYEIPEP